MCVQFLFDLILGALAINHASGQSAAWTSQFGTGNYDAALAVAADDSGVYVAGITSGVLLGQTLLAGESLFVRKYDRGGGILWTRQFGTDRNTHLSRVASDETGVYLVGSTEGTFPGQIKFGRLDAFIRKYDRDGTLLWTRQFAGDNTPNGSVSSGAFGAAADQSGVYVTGFAYSTSSFFNTSFVKKYDRAGNLLWSRQHPDLAFTLLAADSTGVYAGGLSLGGLHFSILRYDANGNLAWQRQFDPLNAELAGMTVLNGNIYLAGHKRPDGFVFDGIILKFNSEGHYVWTRQFGTSGNDWVQNVTAGGRGIYIVGSTDGLFPGQTASGGFDAFVRLIDVDGAVVSTRQFGSRSDDTASASAVYGSSLYVAGSTTGVLPGQLYAGDYDAFLMSMNSPAPSPGLRYLTHSPCRALDTRTQPDYWTDPLFAQPRPLSPGAVRPFYPCSGRGVAYSMNVTAIPLAPLNSLTIWPSGTPEPPVSLLSSVHGGVVANSTIVAAGLDGGLSVGASARTDVIVDINGYFVDDTTPGSLSFYAAEPCRLLDTRNAPGPFGGPRLSGSVPRSFLLPDSPCRPPVWAGAYSLNATVVPTTLLDYLTLWPTGESQPMVSTLNSFDGAVVANAAIVKAGGGGSISAFATRATDLILDFNGFFGPAGLSGELKFIPLAPCRVADTRAPAAPLQRGESRMLPVGGKCDVPREAKAYSLNVTAIPLGPLSYLTVWPTASNRPLVSTLNSTLGRAVSNAAIVPAGWNATVSVLATDPTHLTLDINGYFQ